MKRIGGFSLVEVAISTTVLATAALLLSAALAASGGQKAAARRQALAKSLCVRQLELIQQRIGESQTGVAYAGTGGPSAVLVLANMRNAGRVYRIQSDSSNSPYSTHLFSYRNQNGLPVSGSANFEVPDTSNYHVLRESTVLRADNLTVPNPPGSMFRDEKERVRDEGLTVRLFVSACQMDGNRDNPVGNDPISGTLANPDLFIAQVVVSDTDSGNEMYTLSRMFKVFRSGKYSEGVF